jgi:hypothetical protein
MKSGDPVGLFRTHGWKGHDLKLLLDKCKDEASALLDSLEDAMPAAWDVNR